MTTEESIFWYWIDERHRIYLKKEAGEPWPWTEDEVLKEYSFCNAFRELDKVTIAFRQMLREPFTEDPNLWFMYCIARQINWPDTVGEMIANLTDESGRFFWDPEVAYHTMRARQATGAKVYTGAYMIRGDIKQYHSIVAGRLPADTDNNKPKYTCFSVLDPVWRAHAKEHGADGAEFPPTIQGWVEWLSQFVGWGGFLSYEVATDLRHTHYLNTAPDIMTWAHAGPGALRGLNRIHGRPTTAALSASQALDEMRQLLSNSRTCTEDHVPDMELRDIEHALCETDKLLRVMAGEGRPRAKYHRSKA